jgi:hypothetical protein
MKKIIYLSIVGIVLLFNSNSVLAQTGLEYRNGGVLQNGKKLRHKQVKDVMANYNESLKQYNTGRTLLIVGASGTAVGLITQLIGESKIKKSVLLFNSKANSNTVPVEVSFGFTQTGLGLDIQF